MIELHDNRLVFRFPDVHEDARLDVMFQRTLRIPDDNRAYSLPPGLGPFPLNHVDDHVERLPDEWGRRGGVLLPMYQAETMWLHFRGSYPMAVKVAVGKVSALTGEQWADELSREPQDYLVVPGQPWLDGFCVEEGLIRQFVAMPLGAGYSAEEQLTGEAQHGGLQLAVYPMKASTYEAMREEREEEAAKAVYMLRMAAPVEEMGLAPGGLMRQEIYKDPHDFDAWEPSVRSRCFVHILNSTQFLDVTGGAPPHEPVSARDYSEAGLPWFEYYDGDLEALAGATKLAGLDSVAATSIKVGDGIVPDNEPVTPVVVRLPARPVREGEFY